MLRHTGALHTTDRARSRWRAGGRGDLHQHYFHAAGLPAFMLDLRVSTGSPATSWLAGPRLTRHIGCCVRTSIPDWGIHLTSMPVLYDAIIHFETTAQSQLLPAVWP